MSECAVKRTLVDRYPRGSYLLADKMPTFLVEKPADYNRFFEEQLEKCGVNYFDYYLLHTLDKGSYAKTKEYGGFAFCENLKTEGKIYHFGFSFHDTADVLDQILTEQPGVEFVQLQINYIDWENEQIQSRKCYEVARKHGKPIIVMEPVRGGGLAKVPEEAENNDSLSFRHVYSVMGYSLCRIFRWGNDGIKCRKCENHCPQHIEITKQLELIAKEFE